MAKATGLRAAQKVEARPRRYSHSIQQIADDYGVHPRTVRRWLASGRISGQRIGPRVIRLDPDEVAEQLLSNPIGAAV